MREIFDFLSAETDFLVLRRIILSLVFLFAVSAVCWILGAAGVFKISRRQGCKAPWIGFLYPVYPYSLGRIAREYKSKKAKKCADLSVWVEGLFLAQFVLAGAFAASGVYAARVITENALKAIEDNISMTPEMFRSAVPVIALYFVTLAASVAYKIIYFVVLWRIFSILSPKYASVLLVLSVFFGFLGNVFIFVLSRKIQADGREYFDEITDENRPENEFDFVNTN